MLNAQEIGLRIEQKKNELGLKQKEITDLTGISKGAISNYISGKRVPDTETILKLSKILQVQIEWLLTGKTTNENLSEDEREIIKYYRQIPEKEQIRELGRLEAKAEQFRNQNQEKLSSCRTG